MAEIYHSIAKEKEVKKFLIIFAAILVLALCAGCRTYELTNNKVGWSSYSDISVKDYEVLGIITVESQIVHEYGPLGFRKSFRGSHIVWSDLMIEAEKLGANDVINVRIEETNYNYRVTTAGFFEREARQIYSPGLIEFFTGYNSTWRYKATALAIKYTEAIDRQKSERMDNLKGQASR